MKKILLSVLLAVAMSSGAFAAVTITGTFPDGTVGVRYPDYSVTRVTISPTYDSIYDAVVVDGRLPDGLELVVKNMGSSYLGLEGTPEVPDTYHFGIQVIDILGNAGSTVEYFTVTITGNARTEYPDTTEDPEEPYYPYYPVDPYPDEPDEPEDPSPEYPVPVYPGPDEPEDPDEPGSYTYDEDDYGYYHYYDDGTYSYYDNDDEFSFYYDGQDYEYTYSDGTKEKTSERKDSEGTITAPTIEVPKKIEVGIGGGSCNSGLGILGLAVLAFFRRSR